MKALLTLAIVSAAVAFVAAQSSAPPVGVPGQCPDGGTCTGNGSVSCLYCPNICGKCQDVGVIDHCYEPGTVHLSIDDGPGATTPGVLEVLKAHNISASFWLVGANVAMFPAHVNRMLAEGHFVGHHTYTHAHLNGAAPEVINDELTRTTDVIRAVTNGQFTPTHFRPPFGEYNDQTRALVEARGLRPVMWNMESFDWTHDPAVIKAQIDLFMDNYRPDQNSFILLVHLTDSTTLCTLPAMIQTIRARGYRFVSAQQCFDASKAVTPQTGFDACKRSPSSCTFANGCGPGVKCCMPGACCSRFGFCGYGVDACGEGCVNGPCFQCGQPNVTYAWPYHRPRMDWTCSSFDPTRPPRPLIPSNVVIDDSPTGSTGGQNNTDIDRARSDAPTTIATPFVLFVSLALAALLNALF